MTPMDRIIAFFDLLFELLVFTLATSAVCLFLFLPFVCWGLQYVVVSDLPEFDEWLHVNLPWAWYASESIIEFFEGMLPK